MWVNNTAPADINIEDLLNDSGSECVKCGKMIRTNTGFKRHTELYCETCN